MTRELLNPEGLLRSEAYTHVVVATGSRTVFIAGQVALDGDGRVVAPGDVAGQARRAFSNLGLALAAAGASPSDVVKHTIYVVGYTPEVRAGIREAARTLYGEHRPASTLLGVQALAQPDLLIEVEAIAVLD